MPSHASRREFLKRGLIGASIAAAYPAFLGATVRRAWGSADAARAGSGARILVVLQLDGGNDGLNTVVPYRNDHYRAARPTLGIPAGDVLRLDDDWGLHPGLARLADLLDGGHAAIVHAVGYPNPNRSHFRSTEIWHAGHAGERPAEGWLGRALESGFPDAHPAVGIALSQAAPLALANRGQLGVTCRDPETFRAPTHGVASPGGGPAGASSLDFLRRVESRARVSAAAVREALAAGPDGGAYPATALGQDLSVVARLIAGGAPTRIFYLSQGGYDTHAGQVGRHEQLLGDFADALYAFVHDLARRGELERVTVFAFSEFGRRVAENGSLGTDHGAAGPVFLFGGGVRAGLHGEAPDLAPEALADGDLRATTDFRAIYAGLLESRLGVSGSWLGGPWPAPGVLET